MKIKTRFNAFPILSQYVWPNNYVGGSYENEISYLKNWISERMAWMDEQLDWYMWPYSAPGLRGTEGLDLEVYPNPVVSELYLHLDVKQASELRVEVMNVLGQLSYRSDFPLHPGAQTLYFDDSFVFQAMPEPGLYYLNIYLDGVFVEARKIVKQ